MPYWFGNTLIFMKNISYWTLHFLYLNCFLNWRVNRKDKIKQKYKTTIIFQHVLFCHHPFLRSNLFPVKNKAGKGEIYFCKYLSSALIESPNNYLFSSSNTLTFQKRNNDTVSQRLDNQKNTILIESSCLFMDNIHVFVFLMSVLKNIHKETKVKNKNKVHC